MASSSSRDATEPRRRVPRPPYIRTQPNRSTTPEGPVHQGPTDEQYRLFIGACQKISQKPLPDNIKISQLRYNKSTHFGLPPPSPFVDRYLYFGKEPVLVSEKDKVRNTLRVRPTNMDLEGRSPGSTIAASEIDDHKTAPSSPSRPDPRTSLNHVLGRNTPQPKRENVDTEDEEAKPTPPGKQTMKSASKSRSKAGTQTNSNSTIPTTNKLKHLKKDDGEPLWRKDIQYDFLHTIFEDKTKCFTNSYEPEAIGKQTFADIYIDAMARSSKTSKILRDKLLSEHEPAKNMAMVCLLVNLGRMNTTLNFFPEMRAQLRTYHAIPSLQAHQDPNSYKQLQDAPRLKSILKGASEDRPEPNSVDKIKDATIPRTNPVNLIFVLSQAAIKITELHFPPPREFYDLIMQPNLSSVTRARAFLWLMWHYLESDFTQEGAEENPFGAGVDYGQNVANQGVPRLADLTEEEVALENVDTTEEISYGEAKMRERRRIIEADQAAIPADYGPPKRGPKPKLNLPPEDGLSPAPFKGRPSRYESDMDSTRSTPPPRGGGVPMRIQSVLNGPRGRAGSSIKHAMVDGSSPAPSGLGASISVTEGATRRTRPLTAHQLAVENNRHQRVNHILGRGIRREHHRARKERKTEGAIIRAARRLEQYGDMLEDSEGEERLSKTPAPFRAHGPAGLVQLETEEDDYGEELSSYASAFRRLNRRLERWDCVKGAGDGVVGTVRAAVADGDETEEDKPPRDIEMEDTCIDKEEEVDEEDLDDVGKALVGDETEDEGSEGGMDVD